MTKIVLVLVIGFITYRIYKQVKMEKIKSHWLKGESGIDTFDENDFSKWRQKKESHKEFKELLKELLREPLFWNIISIIILILLSLILCEAIFGSS